MSEQRQINKSAVKQIKEYIQAGQSREEIYLRLLNAGWKLDEIEVIFAEVEREKNKNDVSKKTVRLILIIGVILIGAGVFSFVAANWQVISKFGKLFIIIFALFASHLGAWYLKEKLFYNKTSEVLHLLGSIIYGSGIFLVAQIFNIRANWPDGFLLWLTGVLFLAYVINSYLQYTLVIILGIIVTSSYLVIILGHRFAIHLLGSSLLLLLAAVILFVIGFKIRNRLPENLKKYY